MVDVFRKGKFEFHVLTETKLKKNVVVSCCWVSGISVGVEEIKGTREGMIVWMNDVWYSAVIEFGCVRLILRFQE